MTEDIMPNHVTTELRAPKGVLDSLAGENGAVDFNTVLPMPGEDSPTFTATKTEFAPGIVGYGFDGYSPMDWARQHWGSKWNAYDIDRVNDTTVRFDTAWSHPEPVITALSLKFPDAPIDVKYADEDLGSNLGHYSMMNGVVVIERVFGGYDDPKALDFAAQLKYGQTYAELQAEWDEEY